jgi:hypothetical protein
MVQILMTHPKVKTEGAREMEVKTEGANGKKKLLQNSIESKIREPDL